MADRSTAVKIAALLASAEFSVAVLAHPGSTPEVNASRVPVAALNEIEKTTNDRFTSDPWDSLGDTRGSYLPGYGAIFTFEMSLVRVTPISPFHLTTSPEEIKSVHDRKVKQLAVLKDAMRDMLVKAAATLTTLPPSEQICFEAYFFSQSFEDHRGLPQRLSMTANRQKLMDAVARHAKPAEISALVEEREE